MDGKEDKRIERYLLQSVARKAIPKERVAKCFRRRLPSQNAHVWKHLKTEKCFYGGLTVCGSLWTCPVCAAKISERRRTELKQALGYFKQEGGRVAMLTLTFSHKFDDKLSDTIVRFQKAIERLRSGKRYKLLMDKLGLIGTIRSMEITYGINGFHPHVHILYLYENKVVLKEIEKVFFDLWLLACKANDLTTQEQYGAKFEDGKKADGYVSKWGLEEEVTKSHSKKGRNGGLTPFDFLRMYVEIEDEKYLRLFEEYAHATKSKRQLTWSKGLKDRFLIEEKSDEDLAQEKTEQADLLGEIDYDTWKWILRLEKRGEFLRMVEQNGFESAYEIFYEDYLDGYDLENKKSPDRAHGSKGHTK
ncbi:protein rep [Brevibacillus sp. DP1.3A]|uniref:protein rep n=1 Tax=Brevibacillus sp. DP1.3A TaxID=2738867 RepID=UPI00156AF721|nr:protein rep [Brevibacillus sp. DP1.3A]UED78129.1 protein rep [Brevibacillus sp. DP1.3A]